MPRPLFLYDFNSPYAYLAAKRIDEVIPDAEWQPISFGAIVVQIGKTPWSFTEAAKGQAEIARRAAERGLPELKYPPGWPRESYGLAPLRAALIADDEGLLKPFSHAMFDEVFVNGRAGADVEAVLDAAVTAGLQRDAVATGIQDPQIKQRLIDATQVALERGVTGVPTMIVGDELFWGDDRLEDAAEAARATPAE